MMLGIQRFHCGAWSGSLGAGLASGASEDVSAILSVGLGQRLWSVGVTGTGSGAGGKVLKRFSGP